jgi:hypothetical protein
MPELWKLIKKVHAAFYEHFRLHAMQRPVWVIIAVLSVVRLLPILPGKQTSLNAGMSETCQEETHAPEQTVA